MCGIGGMVTVRPVLPEASRRVLGDAIARRGPDDIGAMTLAIDGCRVHLVHRRLSVIDLSIRGHQPMTERDAGLTVVYNGEIFNYLEIRAELQSLGHTFDSASDTEVLLKAWRQWGVDSLPRFNGMFAFALVDPARRMVWLVRDRFGVKPLVWGRVSDGSVVFSSSVSAAASLIGAAIDTQYCARGLRYKVFELPESGSPFHGVRSVPAGSWMRVDLSNPEFAVDAGQWYDLRPRVSQRVGTLEGRSQRDLQEECRDLLASAVQLRLRSDVPVAVSLSGGLDSSSVAALSASMVPNLRGFTYGSPAAVMSEGPLVARFAQHTGIATEFIWPANDPTSLDALLERTFAFQEAPIIGLSPLAQNAVFQAVRRAGYKVLLGGQGGDETFAGYRKFFIVALRSALAARDPSAVMRLAWSLGVMLLNEMRQAAVYWQNRNRYFGGVASGYDLLAWDPPTLDLLGPATTSLADRQVDDVLLWSLPTLLRYEDRNSMGHSVESRLPFMDFRLVEFALALPVSMKIANGFGKWALREAVNGVVPNDIRLNRRKRGFDVTQRWVESGLGASLRRRLKDSRQALVGHLNPRADLDRLLSDATLAQNSHLLDEALMLAWLAEPVRGGSSSGDAG